MRTPELLSIELMKGTEIEFWSKKELIHQTDMSLMLKNMMDMTGENILKLVGTINLEI